MSLDSGRRPAPVPGRWSLPWETRAAATARALQAFDRAGEGLAGAEGLDLHLAETADHASCSLLRDRFEEAFPIAAYSELLATVAALRDALGFSRTPTGCEVYDWAREQEKASADAVEGPSSAYLARFFDGPYSGVVLRLYGPAGGDDAGPPLEHVLPIVWGVTGQLDRGMCRYQRVDGPSGAEEMWLYVLRPSDPALPDEARPAIAIPLEPNRDRGVSW